MHAEVDAPAPEVEPHGGRHSLAEAPLAVARKVTAQHRRVRLPPRPPDGFWFAVRCGLAGCGLLRNRSRNASTRVGEYGSGNGSRRMRVIRSSRPARKAATASGSCLAALAIMPIIKSVVAEDVPPAEMSGSWIPVTGSRPIT